jgi:hypothetical protein
MRIWIALTQPLFGICQVAGGWTQVCGDILSHAITVRGEEHLM